MHSWIGCKWKPMFMVVKIREIIYSSVETMDTLEIFTYVRLPIAVRQPIKDTNHKNIRYYKKFMVLKSIVISTICTIIVAVIIAVVIVWRESQKLKPEKEQYKCTMSGCQECLSQEPGCGDKKTRCTNCFAKYKCVDKACKPCTSTDSPEICQHTSQDCNQSCNAKSWTCDPTSLQCKPCTTEECQYTNEAQCDENCKRYRCSGNRNGTPGTCTLCSHEDKNCKLLEECKETCDTMTCTNNKKAIILDKDKYVTDIGIRYGKWKQDNTLCEKQNLYLQQKISGGKYKGLMGYFCEPSDFCTSKQSEATCAQGSAAASQLCVWNP